MKITLESSRPNPTAGTGLMLTGSLRNLTDRPFKGCEHTTMATASRSKSPGSTSSTRDRLL
jgi:hypothetical protein